MKKAYLFIVFAYLVAGGAAVLAGSLVVVDWHPILVVAVADLVGTVVIFGFSVYKNNSSVYDAYWSVAPVLIAVYWLASSVGPALTGAGLRQVAVMALVLVWSTRLTLNWAVRWRGMEHEDWRYVDLRGKHRNW
jgi:steroid 5-alpha reductase family enzyme